MALAHPGRITTGLAVCVSMLAALPVDAPAASAESADSAMASSRPRIGLVLAGGGAKGGAHIGVLKVLEQQRVPIDCIAGTSMGALIGAGYAAGLPATDLETFITGIDWGAVVGGAGRRLLQPIEQKRFADAASTPVELGFHDGHVVTPGGLANTSGIDNLLRTYVAQARMVSDFDKLPIPFRAVATDMVTGRMVVLKSGDLASAMRASMAIPGAFAPVVGDGYILADGGMVRNIPVDIARQTCAEVVIVVNLVEPTKSPEQLVQASQLVARSMDLLLESNENVQLESLTERDIRIDVPMGDIGTGDFERVPETIPLGEAAALAVAARLAAYSVPEDEYVAWRERVTMPQGLETTVADVRIEGLQRVSPEYLRTVATIEPGDAVDIEALSDDAMRMAALEDLDSVAYRLEGDSTHPTLVWLPKEVSIGPNVLRPSLGMYAAGGGDLKFLLGVQHVRRWVNERGGQWRNHLQVGYETLISTSFYQPLDVAQRFFVEPGLFALRSAEDVFDDGDRVATYRFVDIGGRLDLGVDLGPTAQLRVGFLSSERRADVQTGPPRFPDIDARDAGLVVSALFDSRNAGTFAIRGVAASVEYIQADESLGSDRDWERVEAGIRTAFPIDRGYMWVGVAGGTDFGEDLPGDRAFSLGGPRTLPAYQLDELRVRGYWLAEASFLWRLKELVPVKNQAIYGGIGLQAAGLYDRVDLVDDGEVYGVSAYIGGPTPIGTFTLGIGAAVDSWGVWLSLGRPIGTGSVLDESLFR